MTEIKKEFFDLLNQYKAMFNDSPLTFVIGVDDYAIEVLRECIKTKTTVRDLLDIPPDEIL